MLRLLALALLLCPLGTAQTVRVDLTPTVLDDGVASYGFTRLADGIARLRWQGRREPVTVRVDGEDVSADGVPVVFEGDGPGRAAIDGLGILEVRVRSGQGVLFRLADVRRGTATVGGRDVEVVVERGAGRLAFDDAASLLLDHDGDGAFRRSAELGSDGLLAREAAPVSRPRRLGAATVEVDSLATDGSALWLRLSDRAESIQPGFLAPDGAFTALDGTPVRLADLRGRTVVLSWWAPTCRFCAEERPALNETAAAFADDADVVWLAPALTSIPEGAPNPGAVDAFLAEHTYAPRVVLTPVPTRQMYEAEGFPRHTVIGPDGRVVFDEQATHPERMDHLRAAIAEARRTSD